MRIDHIQHLNSNLSGLLPVIDETIAGMQTDLDSLKSFRSIVAGIAASVAGAEGVSTPALSAVASALDAPHEAA